MPKLILLLAIVAGLWYWWIYQRHLAEDKRRPFLWKSGFWLILALAIYMVVTGRMHWLGAGIAALVPVFRAALVWGARAAPLLRLLRRFKSTPSQFRSQSLVVTINFASGQVNGEVISGELTGKQLTELSAEQLDKLSKQFKESDKESYVLLQAYLIRSGSGGESESDQFKPSNYNDLSIDEAYDILGLPSTASKEEVVKAHKRLMQRLHPDRGGSDYLAAKINAAKDQLIK